MGILAVSIGNANFRVAAGSRDAIEKQAVIFANEGFAAVDQIEARLGIQWEQIEGSIIASVVPAHTDVVAAALEKKIGQPAQRIDACNCGKLRTEAYEGLLGDDRLVCCARALQKYKEPFVIVDFGWAVTINVVSNNGEFLGGAIMPGLTESLDALAKSTALLPRVGWIGEVKVIGKNTQKEMQSGAVIGLACAVEGFLQRIEEELAEKPSVIITGGHSPVILPHCRFKYDYEPDLLMEGLLSLYK